MSVVTGEDVGLATLLSDLRCRVSASGSQSCSAQQQHASCSYAPPSSAYEVNGCGVAPTPRSPAVSYVNPLQSLPEEVEYHFFGPRGALGYGSCGSSILSASLQRSASLEAPGDQPIEAEHDSRSTGGSTGCIGRWPPQRSCSESGHGQGGSLRAASSTMPGCLAYPPGSTRPEPVQPGLLRERWGCPPSVLSSSPQELTIHKVWPGTTLQACTSVCIAQANPCNARPADATVLLQSPFGPASLNSTKFCSDEPKPSATPSYSTSRSVAPSVAQLLAAMPAPPRAVPLRKTMLPASAYDARKSGASTAPAANGRQPYSLLSSEEMSVGSMGSQLSTPLSSRLVKSTSAADLMSAGERCVHNGRSKRVSDGDLRVRGGQLAASDGGQGGGETYRSYSCDSSPSCTDVLSTSLQSLQLLQPSSARAMQRTASSMSVESACSDKVKGGSGSMEGRVRGGQVLKARSHSTKLATFSTPRSSCSGDTVSSIFRRSASVPASSIANNVSFDTSGSLPASALLQLDRALSSNSMEELPPQQHAPLTSTCAWQRAYKVRPSSTSCNDLLVLTSLLSTNGSRGSMTGSGLHTSYSNNSLSTLLELAEQQAALYSHGGPLGQMSSHVLPTERRDIYAPRSNGYGCRTAGVRINEPAASCSQGFGSHSLPSAPTGLLEPLPTQQQHQSIWSLSSLDEPVSFPMSCCPVASMGNGGLETL